MARGMDYPSMVGPGATESLVGTLEAPGTAFQAKSYGMAGGLGDVITDITTGAWANLPGDIITGLNPATFDIGSYLIVGGLAWLLLFKGKGFGGGGSRAKSAQVRKKAGLTGQIAADQALLRAS
jgi:hypothetical protein